MDSKGLKPPKEYTGCIGLYPFCLGKIKLMESRGLNKGGVYWVEFVFMEKPIRCSPMKKKEAEVIYNFLISIAKHLF